MDVLLACAEVAPIVKGGPVGDVVAALAKTLSRHDCRVTVVAPRYPSVEGSGMMLARRITPLRFPMPSPGGDTTFEATIFDTQLGSDVELVMLDLPGVLDAPGIDGTPQDAARFGLFSRAVVAFADKRAEGGRPFAAVHAHGWHTALVPFLLKDRAERPRTVLSLHTDLHDLGSQGRFPADAVEAIGLSRADFTPEGFEFHGQLSLLKAGLLAADAITFPSRSALEKALAPGGLGGLDGVLRARGDAVTAVVEGIDYAHWSPATDPHIATRYDSEDDAHKGRCKASLLKELDMPLAPDRPLLVFLGPLDEAHGADLLLAGLQDIVRTGARVVIGGEGDGALTAAFEDQSASLDDDAVFVGSLSEPMRHRLVAAADAVLVPSREPGSDGTQLIAQRYGAPPIARAVGAVADTVVDCDASCASGTGFLFDEASSEALVGAVQRAVAAMRAPSWAKLRRRVMRLDVSGERPARRFARLYARS
ncbi:MAG: glycogen synthase [Myxococcales bacterium]|nr:glycogen synthase [Myxococcales bacterium]